MPNPSEICGNCKFFDPNGVDSKPIGKLIGPDGEIIKGLCRAPNGLLLGERLTIQSCTMPDGTFKPRETVILEAQQIISQAPRAPIQSPGVL